MTAPEDLVLDEDGVPILTDVVSSEQESGTAPIPYNQLAHMSVEDITQTILGSESIRYRLDDIAAELTRSVRSQLEQLLRPAIEQAVTEPMRGGFVLYVTMVRENRISLRGWCRCRGRTNG